MYHCHDFQWCRTKKLAMEKIEIGFHFILSLDYMYEIVFQFVRGKSTVKTNWLVLLTWFNLNPSMDK